MAHSLKKTPLIEILCDTREQFPFLIPGMVTQKLDTGDYGVRMDGQLLPAAVERKSISDLLGTIGGGRERFERELERARMLRYFAIVVEGTRAAVIAQVKHRAEFLGGKLTVSQAMGSLAAWDVRGVHVHFEEDRRMAAAWTRALLMRVAKDFIQGEPESWETRQHGPD